MFNSRFVMPAIAIAALVLAAAPFAIALEDDSDDIKDDLVSVRGTVTALIYDDDEDMDDDEDDERSLGKHPEIPRAFVIEDETVVKFGPWWYWMVQEVKVTDVVSVGDEVKVTGEWEEEDGMTVLCAWHLENLTTGKELTIKEEGRPPWAGGPKALGIDPWPPSVEDD